MLAQALSWLPYCRSFDTRECSRADPFLQLALLTSGQAKSPTRALKKARASLTLQLHKLTSGQAFGMTEPLRLRTAYMRLSTLNLVIEKPQFTQQMHHEMCERSLTCGRFFPLPRSPARGWRAQGQGCTWPAPVHRRLAKRGPVRSLLQYYP
jgi:hypothetical protein